MGTVRRFRITINGKVYEVEAEEIEPVIPLVRADRSERSSTQTPSQAASPWAAVPQPPAPLISEGSAVEAPLPGLVLDVKVSEGAVVQAGQVLVILEAMKMENEIVAPSAGTVRRVDVSRGDNVAAGDVLVVLE